MTDDKHASAPVSVRCAVSFGWAWLLIGLALGALGGAALGGRYQVEIGSARLTYRSEDATPLVVTLDRITGSLEAYVYVPGAPSSGPAHLRKLDPAPATTP